MYTKHFRTLHLPWSESITSDDKVMRDTNNFIGVDVCITEKRDGECTSLYSDGYVHARSIDGNSHSWQDVIKALWRPRAHLLPKGWRLVGENLRAAHSITYSNLTDWIEIFAIVDADGQVLSVDDMIVWLELLDLRMVPVLFRGSWDENSWNAFKATDTQEGYVVRTSNQFHQSKWSEQVAKWVRKNHVQTDVHWSKTWVPNQLRS